MLQARQQFAFAAKTMDGIRRGQIRRQDFQRSPLLMLAIGAVSQPNLAHAAARQQPDGLPRSKASAGGGGASFHIGRTLVVEGANHALHLAAQADIAVAALVQHPAAAIPVERANLVEQGLEPPPIIVHGAPAHRDSEE